MYTTSLPGFRTQITNPVTPGQLGVICGSSIGSGVVDTLSGDVRYFAGGYVEPATFAQDTRTMSITLVHLSSADMAQIVAWRGTTLLFRTREGERFFGVYFATTKTRRLYTVAEHDDGLNVTYDVAIEVTRVTFDETLISS